MTEPTPPERGARVRFPPPLVFLGFLLLGIALRFANAPAPFPVARSFSLAAGILLFLAGVGLILWAHRFFARTGQDPKPWKPSPELLLEGPYRFTRNPMYLGMTSIQLGLGLALDNLWIAVLAAASLVTVHIIAVLPEERYLTEKFGDSYRAYLAKVRRYL